MMTESRRDDVIGAIAVVVLLIGTATGNAWAMLAISFTALILVLALFHRQLRSGAVLVTLVAAITAALIAGVMLIR